MLTVKILCVGKLKECYWRDACAEYEKRLNGFCRFSIQEISECRLPENPSQSQIDSALAEEGEKLLSVSAGSLKVALCIEGKLVSSEGLSEVIEKAALRGLSSISFFIGSSFGLSDRVKSAADFRLSMSPMTFPHQLARVMLCEQIYRAFQIQNNGKYHK